MISIRISCLIANLTERKDNNWKDRLFATEGPKTINEIRIEHENQLIKE